MHSVTIPIAQDRRGRVERRCAATSPFSRVAWKGRRRGARREQEDANTYVDVYEARWFYAAVGVLLLCCTDAMLTLNLLRHGASEINPFMAWLLSINHDLFFFTKLALTAAGVVVLVAYKNFRLFNYIKAGHVLYAFLVGYALLVKYELMLLSV